MKSGRRSGKRSRSVARRRGSELTSATQGLVKVSEDVQNGYEASKTQVSCVVSEGLRNTSNGSKRFETPVDIGVSLPSKEEETTRKHLGDSKTPYQSKRRENWSNRTRKLGKIRRMRK
jgi:hypothetical protein